MWNNRHLENGELLNNTSGYAVRAIEQKAGAAKEKLYRYGLWTSSNKIQLT